MGGCVRRSVGPALGWGLSREPVVSKLLASGHAASSACPPPPAPEADGSKDAIVNSGGTPLFSSLPHVWGSEVGPHHQPFFQVVNRLGLDSLSPFNPKERIIE